MLGPGGAIVAVPERDRAGDKQNLNSKSRYRWAMDFVIVESCLEPVSWPSHGAAMALHFPRKWWPVINSCGFVAKLDLQWGSVWLLCWFVSKVSSPQHTSGLGHGADFHSPWHGLGEQLLLCPSGDKSQHRLLQGRLDMVALCRILTQRRCLGSVPFRICYFGGYHGGLGSTYGTGMASTLSWLVANGCWYMLPGTDLGILVVRWPGGEALTAPSFSGELWTDMTSFTWGEAGAGVIDVWTGVTGLATGGSTGAGTVLLCCCMKLAICFLQYSCCMAKDWICCWTLFGNSSGVDTLCIDIKVCTASWTTWFAGSVASVHTAGASWSILDCAIGGLYNGLGYISCLSICCPGCTIGKTGWDLWSWPIGAGLACGENVDAGVGDTLESLVGKSQLPGGGVSGAGHPFSCGRGAFDPPTWNIIWGCVNGFWTGICDCIWQPMVISGIPTGCKPWGGCTAWGGWGTWNDWSKPTDGCICGLAACPTAGIGYCTRDGTACATDPTGYCTPRFEWSVQSIGATPVNGAFTWIKPCAWSCEMTEYTCGRMSIPFGLEGCSGGLGNSVVLVLWCSWSKPCVKSSCSSVCKVSNSWVAWFWNIKHFCISFCKDCVFSCTWTGQDCATSVNPSRSRLIRFSTFPILLALWWSWALMDLGATCMADGFSADEEPDCNAGEAESPTFGNINSWGTCGGSLVGGFALAFGCDFGCRFTLSHRVPQKPQKAWFTEIPLPHLHCHRWGIPCMSEVKS